MADLKKLKKKNRFGAPPVPEDAGNNLEAPEVAPAPVEPLEAKPELKKRKARRKTGRTEVFGTRVSAEFLQDFKKTAFENNLKLVDLLEESLKAYKEKIKR